MSISPDYFKYLKHFDKTVTVKEFFENTHVSNLIALRHDVDHDLDIALELSYWEKEYGIRSTYFLLHSADYWSGERFVEKCLQIQDFGHEIGLHLNVISEWMKGRLSDVFPYLEELVNQFREAGIRLSGVSTHGDKLCYERQFVNYWCFSELRPSDPVKTESGICAEGIAINDKNFQIKYPETHRIVRNDGKAFDFWSVSMKRLGIVYDASHVQCDSYYTDTGGGWYRSEDPLKCNLSSGRHQILMHPINWRGQQKMYFFLSTARSGSKWLVNFLDRTTPLRTRHEFTLNHRFRDGDLLAENLLPFPWLVYVINRFFRRFFKAKKLVAKKRTAVGFRELVEKKDEVKGLMIEARAWVDELTQDYAEANVYLERFIPIVREVFPEATLIHLHRDPRNVIRSILNRNWYNTPEDSKHPVMKKEGWNSLTQFEKACWYIRKTNEALVSACSRRLAFEKMVSDSDYLAEQLRSLNIPVFPRLALKEFNKRINENRSYEFPDYAEWTAEDKQAFHSICDPINEILGYETSGGIPNEPLESAHPKKMPLERGLNEVSPNKVILETDFRNTSKFYSLRGCMIKSSEDGFGVFPHGNKLSYLLIGGGKWHYLKGNEGWLSKIGHYYQCVLDAEVLQNTQVVLICLMYNQRGYLVSKHTIGLVKYGVNPYKFLFKVRGDARRFNIALCFPASVVQGSLKIKKIRIEEMALQNLSRIL
jgi:hypothetical protein